MTHRAVGLAPVLRRDRPRIIIILVTAHGPFHRLDASAEDMFCLVARGELSWSAYLGRFMAPVLLGNVFGGVALVAVLNHAQVTSGSEAEP